MEDRYPHRLGLERLCKVLTAGTWDGDPISDVIVQDSGGRLYLRPGAGNGTFNTPIQIGAGWSVFDLSAGLLTGVPRRSDSGVAGTSLRVVAAEKRLVRARTDDGGGG